MRGKTGFLSIKNREEDRHRPLNPPEKNEIKTKQNKQNKKTTKNNKKRKTKKEKVKNTKIPKKELFSYQSKFSFFWQGIQKLPFLTPWPRKRAPKNTIKIGVSGIRRDNSGVRGHDIDKRKETQRQREREIYIYIYRKVWRGTEEWDSKKLWYET